MSVRIKPEKQKLWHEDERKCWLRQLNECVWSSSFTRKGITVTRIGAMAYTIEKYGCDHAEVVSDFTTRKVMARMIKRLDLVYAGGDLIKLTDHAKKYNPILSKVYSWLMQRPELHGLLSTAIAQAYLDDTGDATSATTAKRAMRLVAATAHPDK